MDQLPSKKLDLGPTQTETITVTFTRDTRGGWVASAVNCPQYIWDGDFGATVVSACEVLDESYDPIR